MCQSPMKQAEFEVTGTWFLKSVQFS